MSVSNKSPSFANLLLQVRFIAMRIQPLVLASIVMICVGAIGLLWWLPQLRSELVDQQAQLDQLRVVSKSKLTSAVAAPSENETRLKEFLDLRGESGYAEQQVKNLFAIANKNGLSLNQADYKSMAEKNSGTIAYQIQLPVNGTYVSIRQFCEEVLLAIPFASLDEMSFKREAIANNTVEAKLRFTLYLSDMPRTKVVAKEHQ